jgi:phosphotransferase system enzyme I (PtsI)
VKKILPQNLEIKGIGVSDGLIIGRSFVITDERSVPIRRAITKSQILSEADRFLNAVENTKKELRYIKDEVFKKESLKEHVNIIKAHISILEDKIIINDTIKNIEKDRFNAEWVFASVIDRFVRHFDRLKDPYLRERKFDLQHLKDRVLKNLMGKAYYDLGTIKSDVILVAFDLSPAETAKINTEKVKGIVTEMGSKTSHTAIVAKALNIPAVVAAEHILSKVTGGDLLIVDGHKGVVIINPDKDFIKKYEFLKKDETRKRQLLVDYAKLPSETRDGTHIKIMANIELPEEVSDVNEFGAEGVGLYRTEFIFLNRNNPPSEEEHFEIYYSVAKSLYPREITIRTFDLGGDKIGYHHAKLSEKNPALGLRAIRFCLTERRLFKDQIKGILRASVLGNVKILFPLISAMSEVRSIKGIMRDCSKELSGRGVKYNPDIKLGVMVEVPSAVIISDVLAKEVDFFSVGTNDLIQYTLAIDRSNEYVAGFYDPLNLAILRMLHAVLTSGLKCNIPVNICGEMGGEPKYIPILIGMGFRELSMNPSSLPMAKKIISYVSAKELEGIMENCIKNNFLGADSAFKKIKAIIPEIF